MKREEDQGTREKLIEAARQEFLKKGYNKASLRSICADAGMTTGALYFFFENKADLFAAIVDPPLNGLKILLYDHFSKDAAAMQAITSLDEIDMDHSLISDRIVTYVYENYDSFMLLLGSAENTVYENVVDEFADIIDRSICSMLSAFPGYTCDAYMSHWMSHISMDAYIQVIKHEKDVEIAKKRLRDILNYLVIGWMKLAMVKINK